MFLCVKNEQDKDRLLELGFWLIHENTQSTHARYVFENKHDFDLKLEKIDYFITNTLVF